MRSERTLLVVLLVIPLVLAFFGWPLLLRWVAGPSAGSPVASSAPTEAPTTRPTPRPTQGVPATVAPPTVATQARPTTVPTVIAVAQPVAPTTAPIAIAGAQAGAQAANDPSATVAAFYDSIARRDYTSAARLWSPRMQATFPPAENINQRFSQTRSVTVQRADVISQDSQSGKAAVAVDVLESGQDGVHHWVGTWYLVRGPNGWLLDQPQLANQ